MLEQYPRRCHGPEQGSAEPTPAEWQMHQSKHLGRLSAGSRSAFIDCSYANGTYHVRGRGLGQSSTRRGGLLVQGQRKHAYALDVLPLSCPASQRDRISHCRAECLRSSDCTMGMSHLHLQAAFYKFSPQPASKCHAPTTVKFLLSIDILVQHGETVSLQHHPNRMSKWLFNPEKMRQYSEGT